MPDREAATLVAWLQTHPTIEIVSRDRASAYAQAVKQGAQEALQVADRYHLLVNLREHLKSFLDHKRTSLPKVDVNRPDAQTGQALTALMKPLMTEQAPATPHCATL